LQILAVYRRPVRKGRKINSDKLAFLYAFAICHNKQMIGPTNCRAKRNYSWHSRCVICIHKSAKNL